MKLSLIQVRDPKMKSIIEVANNIAGSRASVLIQGESGTGKELLARYIHSKSTRSGQPFHAINCAALPDTLLESELFGYERGAFTGADKRKIGKFELASGSTFLLDEISEMPLLLQAKLLRVLHEGEVQRLGGDQPTSIDVRIIATTNRDLSEMVKNGGFREDLFYRLNVIPMFIPPLRFRPLDLEVLISHFVETYCQEYNLRGKELSAEAWKKLMSWSWPGNVRELQNVVERSILLSQSNKISEDEIFIKDFVAHQKDTNLKPGMTVAEAERMLILKTLDYTDHNRTRAAHMLGISIRTLRNKLKEYKTVNSVRTI